MSKSNICISWLTYSSFWFIHVIPSTVLSTQVKTCFGWGKALRERFTRCALLCYWRRCSYLSSCSQSSVVKNVADFDVCWRHWSQILTVITTEHGSFWARYKFHTPLIFAIFSFLFWSLPRCLPSLRHFNICLELHSGKNHPGKWKTGNEYLNLKKFWKDVICKGKIQFICSILICDRVGQNKAN